MPSPTHETKGAGFGPMYNFMAWVGDRSAAHFFRKVVVVGGHDVPKEGQPIILCCTHFSTLMDVAIISAKLPHNRSIHYWAKRGLYKRQPFRWILQNSGNIQVDRKTKNNQDLFAGTFKAMEAGEAIGLFPEGGSYTEHRFHSMKAGAAWAALEYARHLVQKGSSNPTKTQLLIVPASINYTDKSRFRSQAVFQFGTPFSVDQYTKEFLADDVVEAQEYPFHLLANNTNSLPSTPGPSTIVSSETEGPHPESRMRIGLDLGTPADPNGPVSKVNGLTSATLSRAPATKNSARAAVTKLTDRIGAEIYKMTIDAPDWTTWHSIKMARELIWQKAKNLPLTELVPISNAIVSILNAPIPEARRANESLCTLQSMVIASSTDVYTLNVLQKRFKFRSDDTNSSTSIAIPSKAEAQAAVPSLLAASSFLLFQILTLTIRLLYVAPLSHIYLPAYAVGWGLSLRYASHEEESMSSAKSLCAFVIALLTHGFMIFIVAALFLFTPPGWIMGIALSFAVEKLHVWMLDETYDRIKLLVASYRLFAASIARSFGAKQYGAEDRVIRIAVDAIKSQSAIQFTLIKALRMAPKSEAVKEGTENGPVGLTRPACSQVMGATLQAHARAERALGELFQELKRLEYHKDESVTKSTVTKEIFTNWNYLRSQMENNKKGRKSKEGIKLLIILRNR